MRSGGTVTSRLVTWRATPRRRHRRWRAPLLSLAMLAALLCGLAVLSGSAWAGGWTSRTSGITSNLAGVAFTSPSDGWAVGADGTILATTDGGSTWNAQTSGTSGTLYGVAFANASDGWVVGTDGSDDCLILATMNGGTTWNAQPSGTSGTLYGVAFANASDGWAVGTDGTILATTDGGTTWNAQPSGTSGTLYGVAFANASDGWAGGTDGTILATTNGGTTWNAQTSGTTVSLHGVAFANASDGWAVGYEGINSGAIILATTNGGTTWSAPGSGSSGELLGVTCSGASHVWAVGGLAVYAAPRVSTLAARNTTVSAPSLGLGFILASADGGLTWGAQASYANVLSGVAFSDTAHGWAVGIGGTIMAYTCATPVVTVNGAGDAWHSAKVNLAVNVSVDPALTLARLQYSTNGDSSWKDVPGGGSTRTLPISSSGLNNVTVRATDSGGQTGSATVTVKIDRVTPTIGASASGRGWQRRPVTLTFKPKVGPSGVARVQYRVAAAAWKQVKEIGGFYRATIEGQGVHKVRYRVRTNAGLTSEVYRRTVKIDLRAPHLRLASRDLSVTAAAGATLPIMLKWSDNYSSSCRLHVLVTQFGKLKATRQLTVGLGGSWQTVNVPWGTLTGRFTVTLRLYDAAGNLDVAHTSVVASD